MLLYVVVSSYNGIVFASKTGLMIHFYVNKNYAFTHIVFIIVLVAVINKILSMFGFSASQWELIID